ncbi:unnamed protein product [Prunus armeniaca]
MCLICRYEYWPAVWSFPNAGKLLYTPVAGGDASVRCQGWIFVLECSPRHPEHDGMLGFRFGYHLIIYWISHIRSYPGSICSASWIDFIRGSRIGVPDTPIQ